MKTKNLISGSTFTLFCLILLLALFSCKKNEEEQVRTCDLTTTTDSLEVNKIVTYTATSTGDGTFAKITYQSFTGTVTVSNPVLPWTVTVPLAAGTKVLMTGLGTVKNGSLLVKFLAAAPGDTSYSTDKCSQSISK